MPGRNLRYAATAGAVLLSFTSGFELTVTSTAAPTIVRELGGVQWFSWIFAAYTAAMTLSVPLWGKLADRHGRRVCVAISIIGFAAATAGAGFSTSLPMLVGWRFVEGIFGGAFTALGSIIMADLWPLEKRPKVQALIVVSNGLASVVGPALGAFLVHTLSWRWCFFVTLPGLALCFALLMISVPRHERSNEVRALDLRGLALFAPLLACVLVAVGQLQYLLDHPLILAAAVAGIAALLWIFLAVERRASDPLVPLELFRIRFFTASNLVIALTGVAVYGAVAYLPLYARHVSGFSTQQAAHLLTPLGIVWVGLSSASSFLALRWGFRTTTWIGATGCVIGFLMFLTPGLNQGFIWMAGGAAAIGLCGAFCLPPLVIGCQSAIPKTTLGAGTSALLFARNIGSSVGVAIMGIWLGSGPGAHGAVHAASVTNAFLVGLAAAILMLGVSFLIPQRIDTT